MSKIYFYKGHKDILEKKEKNDDDESLTEVKVKEIQKELLQVFDVQNLSFLFGAGCSSYWDGTEEIGIPTMAPMAKEFYEEYSEFIETDKTYVKDVIKIDITGDRYNENLEKFLEVLFSYKYLLESQTADTREIDELIEKTKKFIFDKCNISNDIVTNLYEQFYKKLVYRDNNLSQTNIFTTNYDLFNEKALDQLGIIYSNGFSGVFARYFNPTVFSYAFAEQMDLNNNKWNVIDNFIYLYKLHGSISWIEDDNPKYLFKIKEIQEPKAPSTTSQNVMIYPTPIKQNASFGSPYSDLFREFQKKLMMNNNILITVGYSFSDEHINNLIYQALTIPTFRLIIIGDIEQTNIKKLFDLQDPRIWIIGGSEEGEDMPTHFFKRFIEELLPNIDQEKIEKSVQKVINTLIANRS